MAAVLPAAPARFGGDLSSVRESSPPAHLRDAEAPANCSGAARRFMDTSTVLTHPGTGTTWLLRRGAGSMG